MPYKDPEVERARRKANYEANKERRLAQMKAYREAHREELKAKAAAKYERTREQVLERMRDYYEANKEECKARSMAHYEANREHHTKRRHEWTKANPDRALDTKLRRNYGITLQQYAVMLEEQGGTCAICRTDDWGKRGPCVDHNHTTNKVRAILCGRCNTAIGQLRENPAIIRAAADYIERHNQPGSQP
jgi:hypothetical protein